MLIWSIFEFDDFNVGKLIQKYSLCFFFPIIGSLYCINPSYQKHRTLYTIKLNMMHSYISLLLHPIVVMCLHMHPVCTVYMLRSSLSKEGEDCDTEVMRFVAACKNKSGLEGERAAFAPPSLSLLTFPCASPLNSDFQNNNTDRII